MMKRYEKVNGKYKPEDVEECLQAALADSRIEGIVCTPEEIDLMRRYGNGELTKSEYFAAVLELVGKAARK